MEFLKRKVNTKKSILFIIVACTIMFLSMSYSVFITNTSSSTTSEFLVGNLMYGLNIYEVGSSSPISGTSITIEDNTSKYYYIDIYSINQIESKYFLAYDNNNVAVQMGNRSGWSNSGNIKDYGNYTYQKRVKVLVTNNSGSSQTVNFKVFGGYNYNGTANILIGQGYYTVADNTLEENIASGEKVLYEQIEEDTNCTESTCLYGGESEVNYLKLNSTSETYRIIGRYTLDNSKVTKIALNTLTGTSNYSDIDTNLTSFYNNSGIRYYNYDTNKYDCSSNGCTSYNGFTKLGLLSNYEYQSLGNANSYLYINEPYYIIDNSNIKQLNIDNTLTEETSSKLRPVAYLKADTNVTGSGTSNDPFIIANKVTISITNGSVDQTSKITDYNGSLTFTVTPNTGYKVETNNVDCNGGASASIDGNILTISNITTTQTCTVTPVLKTYTVTGAVATANTGTVTSSSSIIYGETTTLTVKPASGYYLASGSCTPNTYTITNMNTGLDYTGEQTVTINNNNANSDVTCTFTFEQATVDFTISKTGDSIGTVTIAYTNGSGTNDSTTGTSAQVKPDTNVTLTFSNNGDYYVQSVSGCTTSATTNNSDGVSLSTATISNVSVATTCTINYAYLNKWTKYIQSGRNVCTSTSIPVCCSNGNNWWYNGTSYYGTNGFYGYYSNSSCSSAMTTTSGCKYYPCDNDIESYWSYYMTAYTYQYVTSWNSEGTVASFNSSAYTSTSSQSACSSSPCYVKQN